MIQSNYMLFIGIILIIGIFVGVIIALVLSEDDEPVLIKKQSFEKKDNLKKITKFVKDKGKVSNDDVERICKVSNTSAWRYLEELENMGELRQVGESGQSVYYEKA